MGLLDELTRNQVDRQVQPALERLEQLRVDVQRLTDETVKQRNAILGLTEAIHELTQVLRDANKG